MIIKSILDTDLYEFSLSYLFSKLYPDSEGEWVFRDRNNEVYTQEFLDVLNAEIDAWCEMTLTQDELDWCSATMTYIPRFYWEWLRGFRFERNKIDVNLDADGHLHITVCDKMYKAMLYEVPLLAMVSEVRGRMKGFKVNMPKYIAELDKKIDLSNENRLMFSEFGTRRRFSYEVQEAVLKRIKERSQFCSGTSNVYLAKKFGMRPIGTMNHALISFHCAYFGYRMGNFNTMEAWIKCFDGDLGIVLTDTVTSKVFFDNFSMKHAKLFDGLRQDSGDEYKFVDMAVARYREHGIDPMTKTIIFSNALDMQRFVDIAEYCKGKIKCAAGIGTNLVCDLKGEGYDAANIVMKIERCRMNPRHPWLDCVKISDDEGKHQGAEDEIEICKATLGIK